MCAAAAAVLTAALAAGMSGCGAKTQEIGGELVFAIFRGTLGVEPSYSDRISKSVDKVRMKDGETKEFDLPFDNNYWFEYGIYYSPDVPGHFTPFLKDLVYSYSYIEWDYRVTKLNAAGEEVEEEDFSFNERKTKEQMLGTHILYFDYYGCQWGNLKFKPIETKLILNIYESVKVG